MTFETGKLRTLNVFAQCMWSIEEISTAYMHSPKANSTSMDLLPYFLNPIDMHIVVLPGIVEKGGGIKYSTENALIQGIST